MVMKNHVIFHIKSASRFRFHGNISRLSASMSSVTAYCAQCGGYVEISVSK